MLKYLFVAGAMLFSNAYSQTITNLSGVYRNGQVFLVWNNIVNATAFYKVYRSSNPITSASQLAGCEYLGYTNNESAVNHNMSDHDSITRYLKIESGGTSLSSSKGLFVATTLVNGSYYYAVTTLINNIENLTIVSGTNSLANAVSETVSKTMPVLQEVRTISSVPIEIYTSFISSKFAVGQPLMLKAGFLPVDFAVNRNNATGTNPIRFFFHGGGADYIDKIQSVDGDEVRINIEDNFPDETLSSNWWGSNPAYDIYNTVNNVVAPTTGINNNYSQQRVNNVIDWAINQLPIDSNRIYIQGTSDGSGPAFNYAISYPERIAAVKVHCGAFDFGFLNDWQSICTLNPGKKNRVKGDLKYGTVATNLMCNLGIRTYEAMNGGWMIHQYPTRDYPFIYSINGKMDKDVGWTEKTVFYDSLNRNHLGGYFFWDNRDHGGNTGQTWGDSNFDLYRFRRNVSFPAFAFCSLNEDFGNGNGLTGADHGTVNGALNWSDKIIDNTQTWQIKVFVRNLIDKDNNTIVYPDSCTADVTPRRLQNFLPSAGSTLNWQVNHLGKIVQSGSINYQGGLIVIPQVKIFRDTSTLILSSTSSSQTYYYLDADGDGFGILSTSFKPLHNLSVTFQTIQTVMIRIVRFNPPHLIYATA